MKTLTIKFFKGGTICIHNCIHIKVTIDTLKVVAILDGIVAEKYVNLSDIKYMKIDIEHPKKRG